MYPQLIQIASRLGFNPGIAEELSTGGRNKE
jgi:hypothetical protein